MNLIPIAIYWMVALYGVGVRRRVLLYLFFVTVPLGSFATIPPAFTGGLTLTPAPTTAALIILTTIARGATFSVAFYQATRASRLMFLILFWLTACFSTIFMPRLFEGSISVIPVRFELLSAPVPLHPTAQNMSQLAYLTISIFFVFALFNVLRQPKSRSHAIRALFIGGAVTVLSGMLDFMTQYFPISALLAPLRTATYALLTDVEVLGGKRVVGLMPESSSFGSVCLNFAVLLFFLTRAIPSASAVRPFAPALIALLILFAWLSKSSSTYVGLAVFGLVVMAEWVWRFFASHRIKRYRESLGLEFWVAIGSCCICIALFLINPKLFDDIAALIDRMVLQKTNSSSFEERSMWTAVSWQALIDSYGLGVGVGSTRASNAFVAVASSTGVIGASLFYAFLVLLFFKRAKIGDIQGGAILSAYRWSFFPGFFVGLLIGTSPDFGTWTAFRFALVLGAAHSFSSAPLQPRYSLARPIAGALRVVAERELLHRK